MMGKVYPRRSWSAAFHDYAERQRARLRLNGTWMGVPIPPELKPTGAKALLDDEKALKRMWKFASGSIGGAI